MLSSNRSIAAPAPGFERAYLPGEIEYYTRERRLRDGIPIEAAVLDKIEQLMAMA